MKQPKFRYRESIVDLLRDIASEAPRESMVELVCGWFDDFYLPGFDPSLYTPEANARGKAIFASCFSAREMKAMREFHLAFDDLTKALPNDLFGHEFQKNAEWQKIRAIAEITLEKFRT